jgi:hypothetical protein
MMDPSSFEGMTWRPVRDGQSVRGVGSENAHSFRFSLASNSAMRASRSASWSSSHATSCSAAA